MIRPLCSPLVVLSLATISLSPAFAQDDAASTDSGPNPAAGVEVWASTDADNTDVIKVLGRALWNFEGRDKYQGIAVEKAWFRPLGGETREYERIYLDLADSLGDKWLWRGRIGTDGDTVLGSANLRRRDWKYEFFVEREIIETPRGVDEGIYYTFVGANLDLPVDDSNSFSVMGGIQEFTGDNVRLHARANYVRVLDADIGLSGQLRTRYYHSTHPGEFDYFSPRDYGEMLPVLQVRRFDNAGWMYLVAAGYGAQKATSGDWQASRYANLKLESPRNARSIDAYAEVVYSNNSITGGLNYDYVLGRAGLTFGF
jgi:hypothetical protein